MVPCQSTQPGIHWFRNESSRANLSRQSIEGDALARVEKGEKVLESQLHTQWQGYASLFSTDAFAALEKVSAQAAPVIQQ